MIKKYASLILLIVSSKLNAQSTSVFDACYFQRDNTEPPLKIGKGFHINDVYKQTANCFTPASCSESHLKTQQTGRETSMSLYYTMNEEEFNNLKTKGLSGKISFLNMFSIGSQSQESFSKRALRNTERLVLIGKVDFGVYSYDSDPVLCTAAKTLIDKKKTAEFIESYGTHYISGVRRESTIWIILTKTSGNKSNTSKTKSKLEIGAKIPFKANGSLQISDGAETEELLRSNSYDVSIEVNGPPLQMDLVKQIQDLLGEDKKNKLMEIKHILSGVFGNISDPKNSGISQYYYTPFTLKGLKGIFWDERKQEQLIRINEYAMQIYTIKSQLEPLASFSGQSILAREFDSSVGDYSKSKERKTELIVAYQEQQPVLKKYKTKLDTFLLLLEKNYKSCSDIFCGDLACCNNLIYEDEMQEVLFNARESMNGLEAKIKAAADEFYEETAPACEKENTSTVTIINKSDNPYDLYQDNRFLQVLHGGQRVSIKVRPGDYYFSAVQKSGYAFYATRNNRSGTIKKCCEELEVKIGFED